MSDVSVLLCDDHAVLRAGLSLLIDKHPDLRVVGEAGTVARCLELVRELEPNVVLLDVSLPDGSGIDSIQAIRAASPSSKVLVLTMHEDASYARCVIDNGGAGYVVKRSADVALLSAIRSVHAGGYYLDGSLAQSGMNTFLNSPPSDRPAEDEEALLSPREREVLRLVAHGHTNREVAEQLELSVKSVETYRARLSNKLRLRSRAELVRYALQQGILGKGD